MAERDKEKQSILGLGLPKSANDPDAWRPSKAARRVEAGLSLSGATAEKKKPEALSKNPHIENRRDSGKSQEGDAATESHEANAAWRLGAFAENVEAETDASWRPSKANQERLSSLSPERGRKRLAMSARTRLIFTAALFACGVYFFVKVWLMPQAAELHVALVIAAVAMLLLFASAIVGAARRRRHRKRGDPQSMLRL